MAERPHSRKVKIVEGTAQVRKGEKIEGEARACERKETDKKQDGKTQSGD